MRPTKYQTLLKPLLQHPFFTNKEAHALGVPRYVLAYYVKKNLLLRLCAGIYRMTHNEPFVPFEWENLAIVAASTPKAVICLISALCHYGLTDQIMREVWIAIPHDSYPPQRPNTRVVKMRNIELGKTELQLGKYSVQIFDRERCIVDAFRLLSKEIAIKALQSYFRSTEYRPQLQKLGKYAKALRVDLTPYILSCMA